MAHVLAFVVALSASAVQAPQHPHPHAPHAHPKATGKTHLHKPGANHAAPKGNRAAAKEEKVEQIEEVEAVESVDAGVTPNADGGTAAAKAAGPSPLLGLGAVLGHLHAAVVHLPIAWLALWAFFEALSVVWRHPWLLMSGLPMSIVSVLSFGPAVYTGLARLDELATASPGYDVGPALLHRNLLFAAWGLCGVACMMRLTVARPTAGTTPRLSYRVLVWVAFAITGWSAHLGGCLVYGDDFLPF